MAYPTLSNVKASLRITDSSEDTVIQNCLDQAVEWVEKFTGRKFSGSQTTVTDEQYDLDTMTQTTDGMFVQLRQMDISEITSVSLGDQVLASDDYKWTPEGRLIIFGRIFDIARRAYNDFQYVKVTYKYGAATNSVVNGAIQMLAMSFWNDRLAMASTSASSGVASSASSDTKKSESIGEYSVNYGGGNQSASKGAENLQGGNGERSTGTMNSISRMLNSYRKRRV